MIQLYVILLIYIIFYYSTFKKKERISKKEIIQKLLRQAARWSTAARQDKALMIKVLHACYGAGYLWALKEIATVEEIERNSNVDMTKFEKEITSTMDNAQMEMIRSCEKYPPKRSYLTQLAKEGI